MRLIRILFVAAVGVALAAAVPSSQAAEKGKDNKGHAVHGVVSAVDLDKDKGVGTITVHIAEHKNKKTGEVKPAEGKTFKVTDATKFIEVTGKKGDRKEEPVTFAAVKDGEHVVVKMEGDVAVQVAIHHHAKKAA